MPVLRGEKVGEEGREGGTGDEVGVLGLEVEDLFWAGG